MKKYFFGLLLISLLFLTSCSKDNESSIEELKNTELSADNFFETILSKELSNSGENVFYIKFDYNSKDKSIKINSIIEKEPTFFVLENNDSSLMSKDAYKVTCTKGGKDVFTKSCDGKFSCGTLIYDCLNQGGCAEICANQAIYMPQNQTFYISQDME